MTGVVDHVVATPDPPSPGVHNPIHDAEGADSAGYSGALVAGVRTYGWAARTIARALGDEWLNSGWVEFKLNRPLYAAESVTIEVQPGAEGTWDLVCRAGEDERVVLQGQAGMGDAAWRSDLKPPVVKSHVDTEAPLPSYDLATVPLEQALHPLGAWVSADATVKMVRDGLSMDDPRYTQSDTPPIHPHFLAGRVAPLTRHNFTYGPTIHVSSQIQHVREGRSDREIVVGAQIVDAYERNDHWYQVLDAVVSDEEGELALIRHKTIFSPRGTRGT